MAGQDPVIEKPLASGRYDPRYPNPTVLPDAGDKEFLSMQVNRGGSMPGPTQQVPMSGLQNYSSLFGRDPSLATLGAPPQVKPQALPQAQVQVPSGAGVSNFDPSQLMKYINQTIDPNVLAAGMTPVPTGHDMQMPPEMTTPLAPARQMPMDERHVVGRHAARMQGIENAFTGMANAVGSVTRGLAEKDRKKTAQSTARLMDAQHQIDQATLALKTAPPEQRKQLEDSISRNKFIMNTILGDSKTRKSIENGLNISFTDPSKNKTDDHAGVQEGRKAWADQFAERMPTTLGPDPMAQQKLNLAIAQQQSQQKAVISMIPRLIAAQGAMERLGIQNAMKLYLQADKQSFDAAQTFEKFKNSVALKDYGHSLRLEEIQDNITWSKQAMLELWRDQQLDPTKINEFETKFYQQMSGDESRLMSGLNTLTDDLAKTTALLQKTTDSAVREQLQAAIGQINARIAGTQEAFDNLQKYKASVAGNVKGMKEMSTQGVPSGGGGTNAGPSSNQPTPLPGVHSYGLPPVNNFDPSSILQGLPAGITGLPPATSEESGDDEEYPDQ